jgi:hypothetical protein
MVSTSSSSLSTSGKRKSLTNANKKKIKNITTCSAITNTAATTPNTSNAASKTSLKLSEKSKRISTGSNVKKKKAVKKHKAIKISAMTVASIATSQIVVTNNEKENENQEVVEKSSHKKSSPPTNKTKLKKKNKSTKRFTPLPLPLPKLPTPTDSPSKYYAHDQTKLNELSSLNARLDDLSVQLTQLRSPHSTAQFHHHPHPELSQYLNDICELESESDANLLKLKFFYDKQVVDVERQCESELSKARQEFNEKRNELKETLRLEQEEARRKCNDIADLSIHYDEAFICSSNAKRKLRRRCNNVNLNIDHLLESPEYGQFFK